MLWGGPPGPRPAYPLDVTDPVAKSGSRGTRAGPGVRPTIFCSIRRSGKTSGIKAINLPYCNSMDSTFTVSPSRVPLTLAFKSFSLLVAFSVVSALALPASSNFTNLPSDSTSP